MTSREKTLHLHIVSDSTGETAHSVARACLVQFEAYKVVEHLWPMVRYERQIMEVLEAIKNQPGPVIFTILDSALSKKLKEECGKRKLPCIGVLNPVIEGVKKYLGVKADQKPGLQHVLDKDYFKRIDAIDYVLQNDDGCNIRFLEEADVVLVGVSRTSKTPTCIYLANRGIKAANIPIVPGVDLPENLFRLKDKPIIGLTCDPKRLVDIRSQRISEINPSHVENYVDLDIVKQEVISARKLFRKNDWPSLDVTRRSIEETAADIMKLIGKT